MDVNKYIGEKIKRFRTSKNLTQQEVGEYLGTTSQTVSRYENGILQTNQDVLFKLADFFNVSINDFFPPINNTKRKDDLSILDNVLYTHKDKIDSVKNLPVEKQEIIANAVKSVLDMIDDDNSNQ